MTFDPGHIIFALTILAFVAPSLRPVLAIVRPESPSIAPALPAVEPTAPATQIARLDAIVMASVDRARLAQSLHHHAHEQVDAADYALQGLKNELAAISSIVSGATAPLRAIPARGARTARMPSALAA